MDSPQNNINSVLGEHTTFYNSIITIGSIMAGNTAVTQAPQPDDNQTFPPMQQHFFGIKIVTILRWFFIIGLIFTTFATTIIAIMIRDRTSTIIGFIIGFLLVMGIIIVIMWAVIQYYKNRHLPIAHSLDYDIHKIQQRVVKIFGIETYVHYEIYEIRDHGFVLHGHGIRIFGFEILSDYTSQETKKRVRILCFFGIPLLRKTPHGTYLIGFIPFTLMIGLFISNIFINSIVIYQYTTQSISPRRANERSISPIHTIPIQSSTPTPTIDFASLENTPTIVGTPSKTTETPVTQRTPVTQVSRLYFQKYAENAVDPTCFAVHIRGIDTNGWFVTVDGLGNRGNLDSAGNTNVCGLAASQEVNFTVYNATGKAVLGGGRIPTRGGDLMAGYWQ